MTTISYVSRLIFCFFTSTSLPPIQPTSQLGQLRTWKDLEKKIFFSQFFFIIETITHLHINHLNLIFFKCPGKQQNAYSPRQIIGTPCTSLLVLLFYQASTMKNVVVMFEGQLHTSSFVQTIFNPSSPWPTKFSI